MSRQRLAANAAEWTSGCSSCDPATLPSKRAEFGPGMKDAGRPGTRTARTSARCRVAVGVTGRPPEDTQQHIVRRISPQGGPAGGGWPAVRWIYVAQCGLCGLGEARQNAQPRTEHLQGEASRSAGPSCQARTKRMLSGGVASCCLPPHFPRSGRVGERLGACLRRFQQPERSGTEPGRRVESARSAARAQWRGAAGAETDGVRLFPAAVCGQSA